MAHRKVAPAESKVATIFSATHPPTSLLQPRNDQVYAHQLPDNNGNEMKELRPRLSKIRSSFQDLVIYNEQGQPFIDINRLVYKPRKVKHSKEKEQLSWYLPDYIFIISNFLCLTFSTYFLLNGVTLVSWRNSMRSFNLGNCNMSCGNCDNEMNEEICQIIRKEYGLKSDMAPHTIIRFYGFSDVSKHGFFLLSIGLFNIFNIILGISACLDGNRKLMFLHLVFDVILFVFEVGLITVVYLTGRCDQRDTKIVKLFLERYVKNYVKDVTSDSLIRKDTTEMDLLQISLTCCGVGNWTDYLPQSTWGNGKLIERAVVERYNLDKSDLIIPSSCCRQWWARNIYCTHKAHMWTYPAINKLEARQFRQRISQWGCLPKMVGLCRNMIAMVGTGGLVAWTFHFCLSIVRHTCAFFQRRTMNKAIREKKQICRRKNADFRERDMACECIQPNLSRLFEIISEGSEAEIPQSSNNITRQIPQPPTESEIANMKSRQDFNRLQALMRNTHIYDWVNAGRAFVEGKEIPVRKGNVKKDSVSSMRNRKKNLVRHEEFANMQIIQQLIASPDYQRESEMRVRRAEKMEAIDKDADCINAFDALKLVVHANNKSKAKTQK